jgi:hypothetical protein
MSHSIRYADICLKEDNEFIKAAKRILGGDFDLVMNDASKAMKRAYFETECELKKVNAARQAANLVILKAMTDFGITNWREFLANNKQMSDYKKHVPNEPINPPSYAPKKGGWTGKSIEQMMDENLNRMRAK